MPSADGVGLRGDANPEPPEKPYRVRVQTRMKELAFLADLGPDTFFSYTWDHGYETVESKSDGCGSSHYAGAFHPGGYCWNGRSESFENGNDGSGVCVYCGRTLHE